mmetsp:Transcript_6680/g.16447  ORF Transcript_6680/g.16447 Transcript_6680/m.16447 type:complete len:245 (-) Transcript_6680:639-1373(-)
MNGSRGNNDNSGTSKESLQNKRLKEIRQSYEYHKQTPQQHDDGMTQAGEELLEGMRRNGADEATIAMYARTFAMADAAVADAPDEPKIVRETFNYKGRSISISSEGSRHWRLATVDDVRSIVYMDMWPYKFGQFKDIGYTSDEDSLTRNIRQRMLTTSLAGGKTDHGPKVIRSMICALSRRKYYLGLGMSLLLEGSSLVKHHLLISNQMNGIQHRKIMFGLSILSSRIQMECTLMIASTTVSKI